MDRSVDSIGSCSLDVDADSTDFSDTSGELNFLTPNSAKDIQREFTAGIKERCKIPVINCQAVTTVLDPVTGNISTVLTTTSPQAETATTASTAPASGAGVAGKKPSYLNLACCVNGYSNLTTYDSKLRQDINKSREVSPSRPIIATLHYNRSGEGGNFQLTAPTLSYISMNNSINNNMSNGSGRMMNGSGARMGMGGGACGQDVTDNASANTIFNGNGFISGGGLRTKVISSQSQISSVRESERVVVKKSFIQQRVEKLYGNAEGVVINKQIYNSNERKYLNNIVNDNVNKSYPAAAIHANGNGNVATNGTGVGVGVGVKDSGGGMGGSFTKENLDVNNRDIGDDPDMEALPVMRHLRPEFRAQLQICSPKKVSKSSPNRIVVANGSNGCTAAAAVPSLNGQNGTANNHQIVSNGDLSHHSHFSQLLSNGKRPTANGGTTLLSSSKVAEAQNNTIKVTEVTTKQSYRSETTSALSTVASCDTTAGPTTVANNSNNKNNCSIQESHATTIEPATTVTAEAPAETEAIIDLAESVPVVSQQQPHETPAMKLNSSEVVLVNGSDGGDGTVVATIIRNGSAKNGHCHLNHHESDGDDKENINGGASGAEELVELTSPVVAAVAKAPLKDGNYFLQVLKNEQNRLLTMAADIEQEIEKCKTDGVEISEEIAGYVLVAAGKARLLCSQKMKQFEGLCHNQLNQSPDEKFRTTSEDLRGFWDMVMLQVNAVDASFAEIDSFRRNEWKKPVPKSPTPQIRSTARSTKLVKRPFKTPAMANSNGHNPSDTSVADAKKAAAAKREAQRKQLMELKRKQKMVNSAQNVEIFVPGVAASSSDVTTNGVAS